MNERLDAGFRGFVAVSDALTAHPHRGCEGCEAAMLRCWRCEGRGWTPGCEPEDGMMSGRDTCIACNGFGRVRADHLVREIGRMVSVALR